jgi:cyclophilin family peptidyl-prolyl cis-trans isomerase
VVLIETSMGNIKVELYPDKTPRSVENFLSYVRAGHYDGTIFHRVVAGFVIQGGGYTESYDEKLTDAPIVNEAQTGIKNERGTIAMARAGDRHSGTSQFFINLKNNPMLDYRGEFPRGWGYCAFGKVLEGLDVVDKIGAAQTGPKGPFPDEVPQQTIKIVKVTQVQ